MELVELGVTVLVHDGVLVDDEDEEAVLVGVAAAVTLELAVSEGVDVDVAVTVPVLDAVTVGVIELLAEPVADCVGVPGGVPVCEGVVVTAAVVLGLAV